jgi:hypothetical protein
MVDPSWVAPIITAVITYVRTQGAQKAADKVAEVVGEKAGDGAISTGQKALSLFRSQFLAKTDEKAKLALANVEQYPDDDDYRDKLIKETARLASADPTFARELKALGKNGAIAQSSSWHIEHIESNQGHIGNVYGDVNNHR